MNILFSLNLIKKSDKLAQEIRLSFCYVDSISSSLMYQAVTRVVDNRLNYGVISFFINQRANEIINEAAFGAEMYQHLAKIPIAEVSDYFKNEAKQRVIRKAYDYFVEINQYYDLLLLQDDELCAAMLNPLEDLLSYLSQLFLFPILRWIETSEVSNCLAILSQFPWLGEVLGMTQAAEDGHAQVNLVKKNNLVQV